MSPSPPSANSPTKSENTSINKDTRREFSPSCGSAIFSTELCSRPPRPAPGPPYPSVIVRGSDPIKAVVDAAKFWQRKFKWQCLCIFPGQQWNAKDLWDDEDIHLNTRSFCENMLTFIERDTYYAAKQFAEDWLRAHPDRLNRIEDDIMSAYDPSKPLSIVDKIFLYSEPIDFPRTFLYHVAQLMRITMAEVRQGKRPAPAAYTLQKPSAIERHGAKEPAVIALEPETEASGATQPSSTQHNSPKDSAPSKTNRKILRSRSRKLTATTGSTFLVDGSIPTPSIPYLALNYPDLRSASRGLPTHGPPQSVYPMEPMGSYMGGMAGHLTMSPNTHAQVLKVPKGKPRNLGSGPYNYSMTPHGRPENNNRNVSGPYSRHASGTMSNFPSPQFLPATMAMGQPMMGPRNAIPPYPQSPLMMAPPVSNQHFDPAMVHRGMVYGQHMQMQSPPLGQAYLHHPFQLHDTRGTRGVSMGDKTNGIHYSNESSAQHVDPGRTMSRRASNFNHHGALYDPYNGANPKFSDASVHMGNKKAVPNNTAHHFGRTRKMSTSGNRLGQAQHGVDRPGDLPTNAPRQLGFSGSRRNRCEDDPTITQNRTTGCHDLWIGPKNETVTELFIGDLPDDVQGHELRSLFEQQIGISPSQVDVRYPEQQHQHHHHHDYQRLHAFVS